MMKEQRLAYYFEKYSKSLQDVTCSNFGRYYYDNTYSPLKAVYLCPLCLKSKMWMTGTKLHYDIDFSLDHFPPASVGGKNTVLVCKPCNEQAGYNFDFTLKEWINYQSFNEQTVNSKLPIQLKFENTKGIYKGNLTMQANSIMSFDDFTKYPYAKDWFENILKGNTAKQTITFRSPDEEKIYKAILKAAYLYSFSVWGYDFIYSNTGSRLRSVLFQNEKHPLTNWGVLFHMSNIFPPDGLAYIFKPSDLQAFIFSFKLVDKETKYQCAVSVLIPGANQHCWEELKAYQPILTNQDTFISKLIKMPEDILSSTNSFPYTLTWNIRHTFRIYGETD